MTTYQNSVIGFPVTYGTRPDAAKGTTPSCVPLSFVFPVSDQIYQVSIQSNANSQMLNMQTLFIDNSQSSVRTILSFPMGGETIVAEPYTRGFYPCVSNALTFSVANASLQSCTVNITAYNFIIPPIVDNATALVLGSGDQVLPERLATLAYSTEITNNQTTAIPIHGFVADPYYYVSAINITASIPRGSGLYGVSLILFDSPDGVTITKQLWQGVLMQTQNSDFCAALANINDIMISGQYQLYAVITGAGIPGAAPGFCSINVYGGTTSAQF